MHMSEDKFSHGGLYVKGNIQGFIMSQKKMKYQLSGIGTFSSETTIANLF